MIGVFLFITNGKLITPHVGDIFAITACIAWSLGNVLIRGIIRKDPVDADVSTFFRAAGNLIIPILFIVLFPIFSQTFKSVFQVNAFSFDIHIFPYIFGSALFVCLLSIFLNRALKVASASYMTILSSLSPIAVAALAFIFLHETLSIVQILGASFIVFGGIITQYLKIDKD
jgi:drug/metabolite transporter (DMT)-like permease